MSQRREPGFGYERQHVYPEISDNGNVSPVTRHRRRMPPLPVLAIGILLLLGVVYALTARVGQTHVTEGGIPVITADPTPVRVKPEEPGGMEIPFQNTTVYDELASGKKHGAPATEHLLAAPEQPLPKPEAPAPDQPKPAVPDMVAESSPPAPAPAPSTDDAVLAPQPLPPAPVAPAASAKLLLPPPPAPTPTPAKKPAAAAKPAPDDADYATDDTPAVKPATKPVPASGGSDIQLGAFKDAATAETEWLKTQAAHGEELGNLAHHVERADLGAKGVWYRLKAGPLDDARARQVCGVLKSDGVTCFVPGK